MIYRPKISNCPLCGCSEIEFAFTKNNFTHPYDIFNCNRCGFRFMNPMFSDKIISAMYQENYYTGSSEYHYVDERDNFRYSSFVWKARLKKIRKYAKTGNFLDIGCSFGGLLLNAKKYFFVYGIELSAFSGNYIKKLIGDSIHIGSIRDHNFEKNYFNVISAIELIEHTDDPVYFIKECYSLLKPGGLLVLQTADIGALQAENAGENYHYYLPGHLSYFSEKCLTELLKSSGFSKIKVFRPVEFGLIPKLRKSSKDFKKPTDYKKWITIAKYHFSGYLRKKGKPLTSSMVLYAVK
ncbi:MAG: methyltransferase domain-containing protein [Spirochaetes bacterium]|nr:methyltransferase domain-containing protein [Spirochaetota bacterium]